MVVSTGGGSEYSSNSNTNTNQMSVGGDILGDEATKEEGASETDARKRGEDSSTTGVDEGDAEGRRRSKREERVSGVAKNLGGDRRDGKSEIDAVREESGDLEAVVEDVRVGGLRGADCGREGSDVLQVRRFREVRERIRQRGRSA